MAGVQNACALATPMPLRRPGKSLLVTFGPVCLHRRGLSVEGGGARMVW